MTVVKIAGSSIMIGCHASHVKTQEITIGIHQRIIINSLLEMKSETMMWFIWFICGGAVFALLIYIASGIYRINSWIMDHRRKHNEKNHGQKLS